MLEEMLREASSPFVCDGVGGSRIYAISVSMGERKTVVGL